MGAKLPRSVVPVLLELATIPTKATALRTARAAVNKLLGGSPEEVPERYRQTSSRELLPLKVEQRLIQGTLDRIVPETFSKDFVIAARTKGDHVRLAIITTAGHFDLIAPYSSAWPAVVEAVSSLLKLDR
jgi:pimeloyl-ACP methyl ester carboxylesterase